MISNKNYFVVPHDPCWKDQFQVEAIALYTALGRANTLHIHHIGSTSIAGIFAKPIIDILVEVKSLEAVDECSPGMESLGYEVMGAYGIEGRRYFRKVNVAGQRTHHVHVFKAGTKEVIRHLAFRDFLIAHPSKAQEYSDLKRYLTNQDNNSWENYLDGKDPFIKAVEKEALQWYKPLT